MKTIQKFLFVIITMLVMTSCSVLSGNSSSESASSVDSGKELGGSIKTLYNQYKVDDELNFTNINNIIQMQSIINNSSVYKKNYKDPSFITSFTNGLILGSDHLVNRSNKSSVLTSLMNIANSGAVKNTKTSASNIMESVDNVKKASVGIQTLMGIFGN